MIDHAAYTCGKCQGCLVNSSRALGMLYTHITTHEHTIPNIIMANAISLWNPVVVTDCLPGQ